MKIAKLINSFQEKSRINKLASKQKQISQYVNITPEINNKQIYDAREILANYAKANNVKIKIKPSLFDNSYIIRVYNKKSGSVSIIRENESNSYLYKKKLEKGTAAFEDNFLSHLYRRISDITKGLK